MLVNSGGSLIQLDPSSRRIDLTILKGTYGLKIEVKFDPAGDVSSINSALISFDVTETYQLTNPSDLSMTDYTYGIIDSVTAP